MILLIIQLVISQRNKKTLSMYRNVLFLNYAQIAINTNVSETSKLGDISVLAATLIIGCYGSYW